MTSRGKLPVVVVACTGLPALALVSSLAWADEPVSGASQLEASIDASDATMIRSVASPPASSVTGVAPSTTPARDRDAGEGPTEARSLPLMVVGAALSCVGGIGIVTSWIFLAGDLSCSDTYPPICDGPGPEVTFPVLAAGTAVLAVGIPLLVYGRHRVPRASAGAAGLVLTPTGAMFTSHF